MVRLNAIIERIDYLKWLVSGAVWLRPIYPSPFRDFGYDISDFCAVDPMYGTLADFDRLVERLHGSGMSLLLDFVPNHTSDTHPWFRESRASRDAPKRDRYGRARMAGHPTTGSAASAAAPGNGTHRAANTYYHAFRRDRSGGRQYPHPTASTIR